MLIGPGVVFDPAGYRLLHAGGQTVLSRRQAEVLIVLAERRNTYVSVATIAAGTGRPGQGPASPHSIEEVVRLLRRKLVGAGASRTVIRNVVGVGYGFFPLPRAGEVDGLRVLHN